MSAGSWALTGSTSGAGGAAGPAGVPSGPGTEALAPSPYETLVPLGLALFSAGEGLLPWAWRQPSPPGLRGLTLHEAPDIHSRDGRSRDSHLAAAWRLAPALSLTSSHDTRRADDAANQKYGWTEAETAHRLQLSLGPKATLNAELSQSREERSGSPGRPAGQKRARSLAFATTLGPGGKGGLRLAMTSAESIDGRERAETRTTDAHLSLAPASCLRIDADYARKDPGSGEALTTQSLRTALHLSPEMELSASLKRADSGAGGSESASGLALSAKLAGGKLTAAEEWARTAKSGVASRSFAFAGGFGEGLGRTNLEFDFKESRGEGVEGEMTRGTSVQADRALGPALKLRARYRGRVTGTDTAPEGQTEGECDLEARVAPGAGLKAGLVAGRSATGAALRGRHLSVSQQWSGLRVNVEQRLWREAEQERSRLSWRLDAATGKLPKWAETISGAHQFDDAKQYLMAGEPIWRRVEMPFAGYRLWAARRAGGEEHGAHTLGFAHRRLVAGRLQVLVAAEERPEARKGAAKGAPMALRRQLVAVGGPLSRGLNARSGYGLETGLDSPQDRVEQVGFSLWGELGEGEAIECAVSRESGWWEAGRRSRTSLAFLYSHRVGDEHRVEVKIGYCWDPSEGSEEGRSCRLTLGYEKPI